MDSLVFFAITPANLEKSWKEKLEKTHFKAFNKRKYQYLVTYTNDLLSKRPSLTEHSHTCSMHLCYRVCIFENT